MGVLEWVTLVVLAAITIFISERIGVREKWENAAVYTVVLFAIVIFALRNLWQLGRFWATLLIAFVLHLSLLWPIVKAIPAEWDGIPGYYMISGGIVEGCAIAIFVVHVLRLYEQRGEQGS